ncbi:MAG: hydrogenase expression/formation protein HypE [Planctomycetota bacterium]
MADAITQATSLSCAVPTQAGDCVQLAHGEGGRLMRRLIREQILRHFKDAGTQGLSDAATLPDLHGPLAMTTDGFVVSPLFFPGGDIGSLAVHGTLNDLAVVGATPRFLSLSLVLEEGFGLSLLDRILNSVANAADKSQVQVVTGDTKVVPRGAADGVFINTTGIGVLSDRAPHGAHSLEIGDELVVTGPIGRHGLAVMAARNGLLFDPAPASDSASLVEPCQALLRSKIDVRAMRDATRGGVAAVLHEWAEDCGYTLSICEANVPVTPEVRGACEVLGLDPLHVANEGTMLVAVRPGDAKAAIEVLRKFEPTAHSVRIGEVRSRDLVPVTVTRALGREMPLDEPLGAPLPRIC